MSIYIPDLLNVIKPDIMGWINSAILEANTSGVQFILPDNVAYIDIEQTFTEKQFIAAQENDDTGASTAALYTVLWIDPASDDAGIKIGAWHNAATSSGSTSDENALWGAAGYATHYGSGIVSSLAGIVGAAHNRSATDVPLAYGAQFSVANFEAGDIETAIGVQINTPVNSGAGAIDYARGVVIQDQGVTGSNEAIAVLIEKQTTATSKYAIYSYGGDVVFESSADKGSVAYYTNTGGNEELQITGYDNRSVVRVRRSGGTEASPSQTTSGTLIGGLFASAYQATGGWTSSSIAGFQILADEDITSAAWGSRIKIQTGEKGTTTSTDRIIIDSYGNISLNTTATLDSSARKVTAFGAATAPSGGTAALAYLYAKTVSGVTSLWEMKSDGTEIELGSGGGGGGSEGLVCEGRLTLTSGTPVTTADVTGATNVYFTPYTGNRIALYDGADWEVITFSETTEALGTLTSGLPYDIFAYNNSGTLDLEKVAWTNGTTRATALTLQDGVLVKSGDATRRYLGTFYTTSTTQTEDSIGKRFLWNYYNRILRHLKCVDTTNEWNYSTSTWRSTNNNTTNGVGRVECVIGYAEVLVTAVSKAVAKSTGGVAAIIASGVGIDATNSNSAQIFGATAGGLTDDMVLFPTAFYRGYPAVGYHYIQNLEIGHGSGTQTWYGDHNTSRMQNGMVVELFA